MVEIHPGLEQIPSPAEKNVALHVSPAADRAIREGHPWLYADAVRRQSHVGAPGDLAIIFDKRRRFLAVGLNDPTSPIRVRILQSRVPAVIDAGWFEARLAIALGRRTALQANPQTTGYRLVHGENDGFPGLVLDRYDQVGVLKLYTPAWIPHLPVLLPVILTATELDSLVLRISKTAAETTTYGLRDGLTLAGQGVVRPVQFLENGLLFAADVVKGQKTGFFFDHRENRAKVEELVAGKEVLNVFAYTGAFSLYAARGGAVGVVSLDASRPALEAAEYNFALNRHLPAVARARHELITGDAFQAMQGLKADARAFEVVIVDPPTMATNKATVGAALSAYGKLVRSTLDLLLPGGIMTMASCTARIPSETFFQYVRETAHTHGRPLDIIAETGQPVDHPISFKEGAYLKCLFARIP